MAGDDFADAHDHQGPGCVGGGGARAMNWGTKSAVANFSRFVGRPFFLTFADHYRGRPHESGDSDPEWAQGEKASREGSALRAIAQKAGILDPVRSNQMFPAWYLFK